MTSIPNLETGDQAPWFDAVTLAGTRHNLSVMAGRWVALFFVDSFSNADTVRALAEIIAALGRYFNEDHVVFFAILGEPPPPEWVAPLAEASHSGLGFAADYDHAISNLYASAGARMIVLDPLLRLTYLFPVTAADPSAMVACLGKLPSVDESAGVPQTAPALLLPRVFEPAFCDYLIDLYKKNGGQDSGFMLDKDGKTMTVINHDLKQRRDFHIHDPDVRAAIRHRVVRRVVPMIERFFSFKVTRMDRYLVSCYDAETGGYFYRHRDNVNAGAQHRRFAVSFNLNDDYEGCGLIFPEFGRHVYAAPRGGAIVFATGALHQVLPITRGQRYAFIPFMYGEDEARLRMANNAQLHAGEGLYTGDWDRLFPESAA